MHNNRIVLDLNGLEVFESIPTKFGNGAHALIPKKYSKQKLKVIVGKSVKADKKKLKLGFFGNEILERKPNKFGTGFHIIVPKEHLGKKIKIISRGKNE